MRLNTELAKSIIDRFPEMMQAAAELLRAADGAGMPSRQPPVPEVATDDEPTRGFDLHGLIAQLAPVLMMSLTKGKQLPEATPPKPSVTGAAPSIDPATMAHFVAVQSALTAQEAALAREVAKELGPAELQTWYEDLKKLSVADAVEKIRGLIARRA